MGRKTFSSATVTRVFRRAKIIHGKHENLWRKDRRNRTINRSAYGDRNSSYGWDIHHKDGNHNNNNESNLEAVHYDTHNELH